MESMNLPCGVVSHQKVGNFSLAIFPVSSKYIIFPPSTLFLANLSGYYAKIPLVSFASNMPIFCIGRFASIDEKLFGLIIHKFVLANDEPRGAWKTLLDSEFFGGNALVSCLRRDLVSASNSDFQFCRWDWSNSSQYLVNCSTRTSVDYCNHSHSYILGNSR